MGTIGRYLGGNKGTETPSNLVFFHVAYHEKAHPTRRNQKVRTFAYWSALYHRVRIRDASTGDVAGGDDPAGFFELLQKVSSPHRPTWCFTQNLGHALTLLNFWEAMDNEIFTIGGKSANPRNMHRSGKDTKAGRLCLEERPTYASCSSGGKRIKFVDVNNYWPDGLSGINEIHRALQHNHKTGTDSGEYVKHSCKRIVGVIAEQVIGLLRQWSDQNCGVFQMTAAGLSFTNFRHTCKVRTDDKDNIDIVCKPNAREHLVERESYFGGRIQCYFVGSLSGQIYHLDCNSLYPFVMRNHSYPRRFVTFKEGMTNDDLSAAMRVYGAVARVSISSRHETFPLRIDGEGYHCTGRYWATLCGPELRRAIDTQSVHRIGTVQLYSVAPLFTSWVDYWYNRKLAANTDTGRRSGEYEFIKLILNSLSGKWAQKGRRWKDRPDRIPRDRWGGYPEWNGELKRWEKWRGIAGNAQILLEDGEPNHAFPLISAYICSYGRAYMDDIISRCHPGRVYYLATDGILCDATAFARLQSQGYIHETEIGKFKVKGIYRSVRIHGPNHYECDGKTTVNGHLGKYISDQGTSGRVELVESLPSIIAHGPCREIVTTSVKVPRIKPDHRGIITESGWWVPYRLSLDPDFSDRPPLGGYRRECLWDMTEDRTPVDAEVSQSPLPV